MMRARRDRPAGEDGARHRRGDSGRPRDGNGPGDERRGSGQGRGDERRGPDSGSEFGQVTIDDVRRTPTGWRVGDEEVSDLTSAMVLADLLAADLPGNGQPAGGERPTERNGAQAQAAPTPDVRQLQETVAQLEHALTVRVRVEQAIGILAERHRLRPRQAFELLRSASRTRGRRVLELAGEVVESATNPLLRIPEELARPPAPHRGRLGRRAHG